MVPAATVTLPVNGSNVIPVGHVPDTATVAFPVVPNTAGTPFTLSLLAMLVKTVPPVDGIVPFSTIGSTIGVTIISSETVAQVAGVNLSHNYKLHCKFPVWFLPQQLLFQLMDPM